MRRGIHIEVHFLSDKSSLPKIIRCGDRIFFMDYGTNLNLEMLDSIFEPMKGDMMVYPSVVEGISWDRFIKTTKEGTSESASQRGLEFDTRVGAKISKGLYECESTSARVWLMDSSAVDQKLEGVSLPTSDNAIMFARLKQVGIKIVVASEALVICHFIHECLGNILEAAGVQLRP